MTLLICSLFCCNIIVHRTDELKALFDKFGEIGDCYIPRYVPSMESKGYGFVRFLKQSDATDALEAMDGKDIDGRALRVQEARNKRPDNARQTYGRRDNRGEYRDTRDRYDRGTGRDDYRRGGRDDYDRGGRDSDRYDRGGRSDYGRDRYDRGSGRDDYRSNDRHHDRDRDYGRDRDYDSRRNRSRSPDRRRSRS